MKINLIDFNKGAVPYFNNHWPVKDLEYVGPFSKWDGITVFTDELCFNPVVDQIQSKYKIAWSIESPAIKSHFSNHIYLVENKFDYIYTYTPKSDNQKYKQSYFGACWIVEENCKIYEKTKLLSIVASNKNYAPGHKLRHEIISKNLHKNLELWGSGYKWFSDEPEDRLKPFKDYMYVIVVENCKHPNYFTDKIIDCFASGCIPIYIGPDLKSYEIPSFLYLQAEPNIGDIRSKINEAKKINYEEWRESLNIWLADPKTYENWSKDLFLTKIINMLQKITNNNHLQP